MSTIYKLPLVLESRPEGGYTVICPSMPELITEGDSMQEALANVNDALPAILEKFADMRRPMLPVLCPTGDDTPFGSRPQLPYHEVS